MLKSTEQRLANERERNRILEERNHISKEIAKIEHADRQAELETKDRVDISLKEYEALKEENDSLRKSNYLLNSTLQNILKPFAMVKIPEKVVQSIMEGKIQPEVKVGTLEEPFSLKTKIYVTYTLEEREVRE